MKSLSAVLTILIPASMVAAQPVQWDGNGHYYELISAPLNFNEASADAASRSWLGVTGHLATVTSAEENLFISLFGDGALDGKWLGGFQTPGAQEPFNGWSWITGEEFSFLGWAPGEPNDFGGNEDAIQFAHPLQAWGKPWNDGIVDLPASGYIVEYPVPAPAAGLVLMPMGFLACSRRRRQS